jgi:tetratricopeptide (TPR) repeat protein
MQRIWALVAYRRGKSHERGKLYLAAAALYARSMELDPRRATTILGRLALVETELGHYGPAERHYLEAIALRRGQTEKAHEIAVLGLGLARVYQNTDRAKEAIPLLNEALIALRSHRKGNDELAVINVLLDLGTCLTAEHRYQEAESALEEALLAARQFAGPESELVARTLGSIGSVLKRQHRYAEAEHALNEALRIVDRFDAGTESEEWVLGNMAGLLLRQRRYPEALEHYRRTRTIIERLRGHEHPDLVPVLNNMAIVEGRLDNYAEAAKCYRRAIEIDEQAFGQRHPEIASLLNNLAALYLKEGRLSEAETAASQSLLLAEETLGSSSEQVAISLFNLALVSKQRTMFERACSLLQRALAIHQSVAGDDPDTARIVAQLGAVDVALGRLDAAKVHYQSARTIIANFAEDQPRLASILSGEAALQEELGDLPMANALHEQACKVGSKAFGSRSLDLARLLVNYANFQRRSGQLAQADDTERQVNSIRAAHAWAHPSHSID